MTREAQAIHDEFNEGLAQWCLGLAHIGRGLYTEARGVLNEALVTAREREEPLQRRPDHEQPGLAPSGVRGLPQARWSWTERRPSWAATTRAATWRLAAQINIGGDLVRLGEPGQALALLEGMVGRRWRRGSVLGGRWRWDMRVSVAIAEALLGPEPRRRGARVDRAGGVDRALDRVGEVPGEVSRSAG